MNAQFLPKRLLHLRLAALALALLPAFANAQDPLPTPTPPPDPLAGIPIHVLDQQQVEFGTHIITYNRIVPPVFPVPTPTPAPPAGPTTNGANHAPQTRGVTRTPHTNDAGDGGEKPYKILFLSATVYDHQFTQLRFYGGNSPELSAFVNIDFNYFRGVDQIETADAVYMIMFGMGDDTVATLTQAGQPPPNLAAFPQGYSAYQIIAGDTTAHAEDLAALDALCLYYDDHKAQMIADYNQREADNAAHQQWLLDHPPVQPDTVMYFWPVKGSAYLNQTH